MHFKFSNIPKAKSSKKDGNKAESLSNNDSIQTTSKILEYLPKGSAIVFNDVVDDFQSADSKADSNDKQIFVTNCRVIILLDSEAEHLF